MKQIALAWITATGLLVVMGLPVQANGWHHHHHHHHGGGVRASFYFGGFAPAPYPYYAYRPYCRPPIVYPAPAPYYYYPAPVVAVPAPYVPGVAVSVGR